MKRHISRMTLVALAGTLAAIAMAVPASAGESAQAQASEGAANTVFIRGGHKNLHFVAPATIIQGEELEIVNQTKPSKVGPHTFSLVTESLVPKTRKDRQLCFTPHHICKAVAAWHGVKGEGPPTKNPAKAGKDGWDTMGSLSKKGDSWFTGQKPEASFSQAVTADTSSGPTEIHFMCVIHPWMHGSIEVLPPTGS